MSFRSLMFNEKYINKYVAIKFADKVEIVAYGSDQEKVIEKAKKYCDNPMVLYIPDKKYSRRQRYNIC